MLPLSMTSETDELEDRTARRRRNRWLLLKMLGISGVIVLFILIIIYVVAFSSTEEENIGFDLEQHGNNTSTIRPMRRLRI